LRIIAGFPLISNPAYALTERLNAEGEGTRHGVVRARAQASATESQIPALEARLVSALRQLEVLAGRRPGSLDAQLKSSAAVPAAPVLGVLASPAETIRHRPDIRVAERGFLEVLDAQRALYVAEIDLVRSEADASTNLIAVYKALGGGAEAMQR
jgi:outer membrane protein TolC